MQVVFSKCSQAIKRANTDKSCGCFYSDSSDSDRNIHLHECCEILFCLSGRNTSFFILKAVIKIEFTAYNRFRQNKLCFGHSYGCFFGYLVNHSFSV